MNNDGTNWMSNNVQLLGDLPLNKIVMPASHDSGMYITNNCMIGSNKYNTQTQTKSILDQLNAGCRYFDIRPVLFASSTGTSFFTGHYHLTIPISGCNGPRLLDNLGLDNVPSFFNQVAEFMKHSNDLVILKFSHYLNRTEKSELTFPDYLALIDQVQEALGSVLYMGELNGKLLSTLCLKDYISDGGRVLAVFDDLPEDIYEQSKGIYRYSDMPSVCNSKPLKTITDLDVYDCYADKNSVQDMIEDQKQKIQNPENHKGNLFLLSWTLTQSPAQVVDSYLRKENAKSILNLAKEANESLNDCMKEWIEMGIINDNYIPNLIYVDDYQESCLDIVLWLNEKLHSGLAL